MNSKAYNYLHNSYKKKLLDKCNLQYIHTTTAKLTYLNEEPVELYYNSKNSNGKNM